MTLLNLYRRQRADIIEAFKILKGLDHVACDRECETCGNSLFKHSIYKSTRGHSMKLHAQHQPGIREHFFAARVTSTWNKLSQNTVDSLTVNSFKSRLEKEWINHTDKYEYNFSY